MNWITKLISGGFTDLSKILEKNPVFLDVRGTDEYNSGHIAGAVHIPLYELDQRIDEVKNLNRPVVAYCRSGVRSGKAVQVLKTYNIEAYNGGGIYDMEQQLKQVEC